MHSRSRMMVAMVVAAMLALTPAAHAAEKKDKAAKRMAQMMRKVQQEKAEMQAQFDQEKAALEDKIKKGEQDADAAKSSLAATSHKARALSAELETVRKEKVDLDAKYQQTEAALLQTQSTLETTRTNLAEMTRQYQSAQHDIKDGDAQRKGLLANLSKKGQQVIDCQEKNAKLHDFGLELIKIYDHPSTYEAVLRTEPFAQIKRVELENILQDYRDKLDEQRISTVAP